MSNEHLHACSLYLSCPDLHAVNESTRTPGFNLGGAGMAIGLSASLAALNATLLPNGNGTSGPLFAFRNDSAGVGVVSYRPSIPGTQTSWVGTTDKLYYAVPCTPCKPHPLSALMTLFFCLVQGDFARGPARSQQGRCSGLLQARAYVRFCFFLMTP